MIDGRQIRAARAMLGWSREDLLQASGISMSALLQAEGQLALQEMQTSLSAILAEANSQDPWTSRARPTFLYVIYGVILLCVMGAIIGIWWPTHVFQAAENLNKLLGAVPESLWWLFGAGYLGYTGARSFDKWRGPVR